MLHLPYIQWRYEMTKKNDNKLNKHEINDNTSHNQQSQEPDSLKNAALDIKKSRHSQDQNRKEELLPNRSDDEGNNDDQRSRDAARFNQDAQLIGNKNRNC